MESSPLSAVAIQRRPALAHVHELRIASFDNKRDEYVRAYVALNLRKRFEARFGKLPAGASPRGFIFCRR